MSANDTNSRTRKERTIVCEYSKKELALRIAEGCIGLKRPEGQSVDSALSYFPDEEREGFMRAAEKALTYVLECFADGREPS